MTRRTVAITAAALAVGLAGGFWGGHTAGTWEGGPMKAETIRYQPLNQAESDLANMPRIGAVTDVERIRVRTERKFMEIWADYYEGGVLTRPGVAHWSTELHQAEGDPPFELLYRWAWETERSLMVATTLGMSGSFPVDLDPEVADMGTITWMPLREEPRATIQPDRPITLEATVLFTSGRGYGPVQDFPLTPDNASEVLADSEMAVILWIKFTDTEPIDDAVAPAATE
jgi:hypothetical protein